MRRSSRSAPRLPSAASLRGGGWGHQEVSDSAPDPPRARRWVSRGRSSAQARQQTEPSAGERAHDGGARSRCPGPFPSPSLSPFRSACSSIIGPAWLRRGGRDRDRLSLQSRPASPPARPVELGGWGAWFFFYYYYFDPKAQHVGTAEWPTPFSACDGSPSGRLLVFLAAVCKNG